MLLAKAAQTLFKSFSQILQIFSSTYFIKLLMIQRFRAIKMLQKSFPTFITWEEADQSFPNFEAPFSFFNPGDPNTNITSIEH